LATRRENTLLPSTSTITQYCSDLPASTRGGQLLIKRLRRRKDQVNAELEGAGFDRRVDGYRTGGTFEVFDLKGTTPNFSQVGVQVNRGRRHNRQGAGVIRGLVGLSAGG
jgi:hypothetical protein